MRRPAGRCSIRPAGRYGSGRCRSGTDAGRRLPAFQQAYRAGIECRSKPSSATAPGGGSRSLDVLPWPGPGLAVPGQLLRIVTALAGTVDVEVEVLPAGPWGPAREVAAFEAGLVVDGFTVRTGFPLRFEPLGRDAPRWRGVRRLEPGRVVRGHPWNGRPRCGPGPWSRPVGPRPTPTRPGGAGWRRASTTGPTGQPWSAACWRYAALTGPGGAPAGAGTTSLPRRTGSERSSRRPLGPPGRRRRGRGHLGRRRFPRGRRSRGGLARARWLRQTPLPWPTALDGDGQPVPELEELAWRGGAGPSRSSMGRPVGVLDLDLYGEVVAAYGASTSGPGGAGRGGPRWRAPGRRWPAPSTGSADHWGEPDAGVWESAGPPALLVASRVQVWSALDRMARLGRAANPFDLQAATWHQEARRVLTWLEANGVAADGGLRRDGRPGGGDEPDAALLRIAWRGPWPLAHPIVTVDRGAGARAAGIRLLSSTATRPRSTTAGLGPTTPICWPRCGRSGPWPGWAAGRKGHARMEAVVAVGGSVGLLAETVDPVSGELMGNLPSTAVHLALVDAAMALAAGPR